MSKTALIVDDSRLARRVLSALLAEHGVAADTAPSAETALEYLKERRPDVVFLDHQMPGMDGFEALEAIKANPATATIPVMMYTSQEGELYVGQARALGAMGVLPKSMKPVEVTNVLRSLHLLPSESDRSKTAPDSEPSSEPRDTKELLEELFYEQRAALREELSDEYERVLLRTLAASAAPPAQPPRAPFRPLAVSTALVAALALLAGAFGYLYLETGSLLTRANERTVGLVADTEELSVAGARAFDSFSSTSTDHESLLGLLEWAVNLGGQYGFGEIPLDERRARMLSALFGHLDRIGFAGTVEIDVHVGRYCMNFGLDGELEPAPPEQPVPDCDQLGRPELEAAAIGKQQTLAFANTVAAATRDKPVRVATLSYGSSRPAIEYPVPDYNLTAGQWNEIAAHNQRIDVRLVPEPDAYVSTIATFQ